MDISSALYRFRGLPLTCSVSIGQSVKNRGVSTTLGAGPVKMNIARLTLGLTPTMRHVSNDIPVLVLAEKCRFVSYEIEK